jgi:alkylation response protein AidB-like acyl-CoA dehydrogenase
MDFALTSEQQAVFDTAREFAVNQLAPNAAEWDRTEHLPLDVMRAAGKLGMAGIYMSEEVGGAQSALDKAIAYMRERQAFGRAVAEFQALQFRLADMETELQAARVFLRQAAWKLDEKASDATKHCAMAKRFVTDVSFDLANRALQMFGGYGCLADFGIEKIVRDLRVHQILEGTNEIMRVIIARSIVKDER